MSTLSKDDQLRLNTLLEAHCKFHKVTQVQALYFHYHGETEQGLLTESTAQTVSDHDMNLVQRSLL